MAVLPTGIGPVTGGYQIERSLRFNSADSAYLNRTLSAGNQKTWTWSGWVKRTSLADSDLFTAKFTGDSYPNAAFSFDTNILRFWAYTGSAFRCNKYTTQVFRDVGAWYHLVFAIDTTNGTAEDRVKMYVNGVRITAFGTNTNPSLNDDLYINGNTNHVIGGRATGGYTYFNGYLTEINFIDGQALTPSDFGETDTNTGVWKPKAYTGTYGTNGFYLKFADNSNTTAATLGKDSSGNGNNWTPNNFSVTAGAGNDSLVDTPTSYGTDTGVGGEVRGNYATFNALKKADGYTSLTNGNLYLSSTSGGHSGFATIACPTSGKWYFEVTFDSGTSPNTYTNAIGLGDTESNLSGMSDYSFDVAGINTVHYAGFVGKIRKNVGATVTDLQTSLATPSASDTIGVAYNADSNEVSFYKNGTILGSAQSLSGIGSGKWTFFAAAHNLIDLNGNFGQRAFAYTAPSGFKALCTQNLPTPTIGATSTTQANDYFNIALYAGNGAGTNTVTTNFGFTPDFIWIKNRTAVADHALQSSPVSWRYLSSNTTGAEGTAQIGSLADNSFLLATANSIWNASSNNYAAWCWKASGSTVSNTAGTITSTVSANTTSGFSIVTYTGTGANATVGHGLGVAPGMVIVKIRSTTGYWTVQHSALGSGYYGYLNFTNSFDTANANLRWNSTNPSSTVFSIGTASDVNTNTATYVAYCFAPVAGYSAFGSFTGNGSADGPFVHLGFRPALVIAKLSSATGDWNIIDDTRQAYNDASGNPVLRANLSNAEEDVDTMQGQMDLLSNGFKLRSNNSSLNLNNGTIIYAAFAENPFKYSLAR